MSIFDKGMRAIDFATVARPQMRDLLSYNEKDIGNRVAKGAWPLAFGRRLTSTTGFFIGPDMLTLSIFRELEKHGHVAAEAGRVVTEYEDAIWGACAKIEFPDYYYPRNDPQWLQKHTPGARAKFWSDIEIYLVAARDVETGALIAFVGRLFELFPQVFLPAAFDGPPLSKRLVVATMMNLSAAYQDMVDRAKELGLELGLPLSRPKEHPEFQAWQNAIIAERALSEHRRVHRKMPGPRPGRKTRKRRERELA
jgi:hypothetical protein